MSEAKLQVAKNEVKIGAGGELQIKDQAVLNKLKEHGVTTTADLEKPAIRVGIIIEWYGRLGFSQKPLRRS
jgi:hypothetical protein